MIKKMKDRLAAKIFIVAMFLLLLCSISTYVLIAFLIPRNYSLNLSNSLTEKVHSFISMLGTMAFEDSGALFDSFLQNPDITFVKLINSKGEEITLPTQTEYQGGTTDILYTSEYKKETATMQSYDFLFLDSDAFYTLLIYGNFQPISQLKQSLQQIIPLLFFITIMIAMIIAFIFLSIVTKPIVKTSQIAEKMSELSLDWHFDEKRTDEIGRLQKSLNLLSVNLSSAMCELQNANNKLQEDIEKEKELEKTRLEFFSAISHELKTPITVIKGQLEGMLLGIRAYKDHKKYLSRSLEVSNMLETMVQEVLMISRLETSNIQVSYTKFDIAQIIREYLASTEDFMFSKELSLVTEIEPSLLVTGDKTLLTKVIGNLISNAIFYSPPENAIFITANNVDGKFAFSIENTGVHISNEAMPKIFEAFYRIEQSRSRQNGGSGLGLYLVQKILGQNKSCCEVQNTEKGVRFLFKL